jgi:peptidoglycan/LPS O-acetylase OafA/YrhL
MSEMVVGSYAADSILPDERMLASGDEAGTAPGDRPFRPDVEGLRAVAVLLVVLFHSQVSAISGGYVGVDVFFVISGFVITGVLLRERASSGRTSILSFYGRRCRRIIPAATLVIIATVGLAYWFLGVAGGIPTATDGRWAAVFLANFHFIATGTNYLSSQQPPSPLQNFWSLAVEEQFYVVYPTLFLLVAGARVLSLRVRLAVALVVVIGVSYAYSIVNTHNNPVNAFFSPFTRAWELALGALVAVCTPWLLKLPARLAAGATWLGLGAILIAGFVFNAQTAYPGSLVAIPVVGAALIIAGGMNAHTFGAEALLHLSPIRWLGKISYSLYLWHWPILIIAAEYAGKTTLSVKDNLAWDVVALVASVVTYRLVENPVRHAKWLSGHKGASIGLGVGLVVVTLLAITFESRLTSGGGPDSSGTNASVARLASGPFVPLSTVLAKVAASSHIKELPSNLNPPLKNMVAEPTLFVAPKRTGRCAPQPSQISVPACTFGDLKATRTMVLYGDSHAGMWFQALDGIATREHWKLVILFKDGCPASLVPIANYQGARLAVCDQWHQYVVGRIKQIDPRLLIVSQTARYVRPGGGQYTTQEWQSSLEDLLTTLSTPGSRQVVIGNLAVPTASGPNCLARHTDNVQACSVPPDRAFTAFNEAEKLGAKHVGASYIDVLPWFCTNTCSPVIGNDEIYWENHVTVGYSFFLEGVLAKSLDLSKS